MSFWGGAGMNFVRCKFFERMLSSSTPALDIVSLVCAQPKRKVGHNRLTV